MQQERRVAKRSSRISEVDVDKVEINKRVRHNLGDVTALSESLRKHGLLNPIVITDKNELIAGHRRLEAAKRLKWPRIPARVISQSEEADLVEMEIDENTQRKDHARDQIAEAYFDMDQKLYPGWFRRFIEWIKSLFRRST